MLLHSAADLRGLRTALREEMAPFHVLRRDSDDIVLAADEAATNALRACDPKRQLVEVSIETSTDQVSVCVRDSGPGLDLRRHDLVSFPEPGRADGRGLCLMYRLMDCLAAESEAPGTVVRMCKRIRRHGINKVA